MNCIRRTNWRKLIKCKFNHHHHHQWYRRRSYSDNGKQNQPKHQYDAVIIGGGHNGLTAAAYLQKSGINTCLLERRQIIGGAAVTEEIIPDFKFSRASYVLSLMPPSIIQELELKRHGLEVFLRDPNYFTPLSEDNWIPNKPRSLTMHLDDDKIQQEISLFSKRDAMAYKKYNEMLSNIVRCIEPVINNAPPDVHTLLTGNTWQRLKAVSTLRPFLKTMKMLGKDVSQLLELCVVPASKILNQWFESEPLKTTLALDSVIGAMISPNTPGSGYVLLHHVMGQAEGLSGIWGYVKGGMGSVSNACAKSAMASGAEVFTDQTVKEIMIKDNKAVGVVLENGRSIEAKVILSNATPRVTFQQLMDDILLPPDFKRSIRNIDYTPAATKINMAIKNLPSFTVKPNSSTFNPMPHHRGSIHLNCENLAMLEEAYRSGSTGTLPKRPMIEMTLPSVLDQTLAPKGCHVCQLFVQWTPYVLSDNRKWDEATKQKFFDIVIDSIERYTPKFRESIIGYEILTPPDLEAIFGLTEGNIFHGAMSLNQLYFSRPSTSCCSPRTPIKGLYMCGSGMHPGGGVSGIPGKLGAKAVIQDFSYKKFSLHKTK